MALIGPLGISEMMVVLLALLGWSLLLVWPAWKLCTRLGFPGWFGLAILVPLLNVIALYYVAFSAWRSEPPQ
ncbi:MAG: hypothetical protein Q9Q40_07655 [Acidobacteriota bacterium]|nr:hypothetical protein [Acidobacteriota bacterium]